MLILNDYHVISEPAVHRQLAFLLEHMPRQLHVIVLTRTDPPLLLASLSSGQAAAATQKMLEVSSLVHAAGNTGGAAAFLGIAASFLHMQGRNVQPARAKAALARKSNP